ncbi:MAG: PA0069 family radical SAM protein [Chromatiales bacterium]|nr:PA0069 family radical SAM protein [Chromatiales bacterium]
MGELKQPAVRLHYYRGRGALSQPAARFAKTHSEAVVDDWRADEVNCQEGADAVLPPTVLHPAPIRSLINYNNSPDITFDRTINPYRGCEHGCIYCFARPSHSYLDLSAGLDFETQIYYKPDAAAVLTGELSKKSYRCRPIVLGANTDAYQPAEKKLKLSRAILEILHQSRHPVSLITKSTLIRRDLDLLSEMAKQRLVDVWISVTTIDRELSRRLEPRTSIPDERLKTIKALADAGVPTGVIAAPMIPVLNDHQLEKILAAARNAGAKHAGYILLRLPHELQTLFKEWLQQHYPDRMQHILNRLRDSHGGELYQSSFKTRMKGRGWYADMLAKRFKVAYRRLGFTARSQLDCSQFQPPLADSAQLTLFSE